jgi:hypothetical protein
MRGLGARTQDFHSQNAITLAKARLALMVSA